jgi:hypothetical protein
MNCGSLDHEGVHVECQIADKPKVDFTRPFTG